MNKRSFGIVMVLVFLMVAVSLSAARGYGNQAGAGYGFAMMQQAATVQEGSETTQTDAELPVAFGPGYGYARMQELASGDDSTVPAGFQGRMAQMMQQRTVNEECPLGIEGAPFAAQRQAAMAARSGRMGKQGYHQMSNTQSMGGRGGASRSFRPGRGR